MKKIINGKVYNTETAKIRGEWSSNYAKNDFHWYEETLFQKKNGEFFLYGEGHGASPYASKDISGYTHGEKIIPITYDKARKWAEEKLDTDEYESIFGEVSEDDDRTQIGISLSSDEAELIRRNAQQAGMSISAYIVMKCTE